MPVAMQLSSKRDIESTYTKEYLAQLRESPWGSTQLDQKKP